MKKILTTAVLSAMIVVSVAVAEPDPDETRSVSKYGQVGLWNTLSAQTLGWGRFSFQVYSNLSMDSKFIKNVYMRDNADIYDGAFYPSGNYVVVDPELKYGKDDYTRETMNISIGYGVTRFLDVGIMLPVYVDWMGDAKFYSYGKWPDGKPAFYWVPDGKDRSDPIGAPGDLELSVKFQYPPYPHRKFFEMAYYGALSLPTGKQGDGRFPRHVYYLDKRGEDYFWNGSNDDFIDMSGVYNFYTSNSVEVDMKMLWTWDFRHMFDQFPVLFHVNYGLRWVPQSRNDHIFNFNSAIEVRPADWVSIFVDFSAEPRFSSIEQKESWKLDTVWNSGRQVNGADIFYRQYVEGDKRNMSNDPIRISPGVFFLTPAGLTISAGVDISLTNKSVFYGDKATSSDFYKETGWDDVKDRPIYEKTRWQDVLIETAVEPRVAFAASIGWNGLMFGRNKPIPDAPIPEPSPDTVRIIDTVFVDKIIRDTVIVEVEKAPKPIPTYTITASVAAGQGSITPVGLNVVKEKTMVTYTFNPADGFSIEQVTVNGENQGALSQFTFASVTSNQIITVSFKQNPIVETVVVEIPAPAPMAVAMEIPREGLILRGVNFQTGKATLTPSSYESLDQVLRSLREWPEVKLEIQGHTDNVGRREANMRLSHQRAETVMRYFISQGVPSDRLKAVGYGPDKPISDNDTPTGRELNRRVELKRYD